MEVLKNIISTYKDFPRGGIDFKDVLKVAQHPTVFKELVVSMASSEIINSAEAIISIDARGFIFGSAISFQSSKPLIFARKPGKLPGELIKENIVLSMEKIHYQYKRKALQIFVPLQSLMIC